MATNTYVALRKETVAVATNEVTFSLTGISGYTDLRIIVNGTAATNSYCTLRFNGDTATNYSNTEIVGDGTTATTYRNSTNPYAYSGSIYTTQTNNIIDIFDYSNATTFKTFLHRADMAGGTGASVKQSVGLWRITPVAITSITLGTGGAVNFNVGTTFSLYGIAAHPVVTAAKATGGTITFASDGYTYHAFTAGGTFTPLIALSCDVLAVAGGGGAGATHGGGGGAGGVLYTSASSFSATPYAVAVGAAGAGAVSSTPTVGSNGTNSSVNSLVAIGGGRGGCYSNGYEASNGGSGGGALSGSTNYAGLGTAGQGNNGGNKNPNYGLTGGGGGGAGAVGETPVTAKAGAGGIGTALYSDFGNATSTGQSSSGLRYFGGGGAGGGWNGSLTVGLIDAGGLGGGGNSGAVIGSGASNGQAGTSNTGGGGGCGGGGSSSGGNGGSGVVIVRYLS